MPPSPSSGSGIRRGRISVADSAPLTQWGTMTRSPRMFSRRSRFISDKIQSIAASRLAEPLSRGPKVSTSRPSRRYAALSRVAAAIRLSASGR